MPALWRLTQRRDHRIFQHRSAPEIATDLLAGWGIDRPLMTLREAYPKLSYKVQYAESDYAFFGRILEEAGIAFTFPGGALALGDALHGGAPVSPPLPFVDSPMPAEQREIVTDVHLRDALRPGAYTLHDHDLRRPSYPLFAEAEKAAPPEGAWEQHVYRPGAFLVEGHAREIDERLGLKEAFRDYDTLAAIARVRGAGHEAEAAAWEQKRDALGAELRRRAGAPAVPVQGIAQLAVACAQAGLAGEPPSRPSPPGRPRSTGWFPS